MEETDGSESPANDTSTGKPPSYSEKLNEALKDLGIALDKEIQMLTLVNTNMLLNINSLTFFLNYISLCYWT